MDDAERNIEVEFVESEVEGEQDTTASGPYLFSVTTQTRARSAISSAAEKTGRAVTKLCRQRSCLILEVYYRYAMSTPH